MWAAFTAWRCGRSGVWTDLSLKKTCWNGKSHHGLLHRVDNDDMRIRSLQSTWDAGSSRCETRFSISSSFRFLSRHPHTREERRFCISTLSQRSSIRMTESWVCVSSTLKADRFRRCDDGQRHRDPFHTAGRLEETTEGWDSRVTLLYFFFTSVGYFVTFSRWKMVSGEIKQDRAFQFRSTRVQINGSSRNLHWIDE